MTLRALRRAAALGVFGAALCGTAFVDLVAPETPPPVLGVMAEHRKAFTDRATFGTGELNEIWDAALQDRSRVRASLRTPYGALLLWSVHEPRPECARAANGMLVHRDRAATASEFLPGAIANALAEVAQLFESKGSRVVVACVPERDLVYADQMPPSVRPRSDVYREFLAKLRRSGISAPDLLTPLVAARERGETLFGAGDSHWTDRAASIAAEVVAEAAGLRVAPESRRTRLVPAPTFEHLGDTTGVDPRRGEPGTWARAMLDAAGIVDRVTPLYVADAAGNDVFASNPQAPHPRATVIGTSFSGLGRIGFPRFFAHAIDDVVREDVMVAWGAVRPAVEALRRAEKEGFPPVVVWEFATGTVLGAEFPSEYFAALRASADRQ